jgi:hypothetical protein
LPARNASSSRPSRSRTPSGTRPARQRGLSGGSSGSAPALASSADGVRACRGRDQHRCDTAPVPMPPVATNGMATRARTNCSSDKSPSTPHGCKQGPESQCPPQKLGVASGSRFAPNHNVQIGLANLWQTAVAGSWHAPGRVLTRPGLLVCGEPPAGIEPATPSLPSMRGRFTTPRNTSRYHTIAQVKDAAEERGVGRRKVACSAVSGKSLARALHRRPWAWTPAPSSRCPDHKLLAPPVQCRPQTMMG